MSLKVRPCYENIRYFASKYPELEFSAIEANVYLRHVATTLGDAFDIHFARHGLSRGRFLIMLTLLRKGEAAASPAELAEASGVTRATTTGLLDTLEAAGLIERIHDAADRRAVNVRLTEAGRAHMDAMMPEHYRRVASLMSRLSHDEHEQLIKLLEKIEAGIPSICEP